MSSDPFGNPLEIGTTSPSDVGQNCVNCVCTEIDKAGKEIKDSLDEINKTLQDKLGSACDHIDECIDEIIKQLFDKLYRPAKTCEECKVDAQNGLAGTLEFALQCAGACINETTPTSECGDSHSAGLPCHNCGCEPCRCVNGVCTPDQPCPEPDKKKYIGWCSVTTGHTIVTSKDDDRPGGDYVQVATDDTEEVAFQQATLACVQQSRIPFEPLPSTSIAPNNADFCSVLGYINGQTAGALASSASTIFSAATDANLNKAVQAIGFEGLSVGSIADMVRGVSNHNTGAPPRWAAEFIPKVAAAIGCDNQTWIGCMEGIASIGMIQKMSGADFSQWTLPYTYTLHANCRQKQLNPNQAMAAYLSNQIDILTLDAYWAIDGLCPEALQQSLVASKAKPVPRELIDMRLRAIISPQQYADSMRILGYIDSEVPEQIFETAYTLPDLNSVISFGVHGLADATIVDKLGLDTGFEAWYAGDNKAWLTAHGIVEGVAKQHWLNHWSVPSHGMLAEFYHRFRDDGGMFPDGELLNLAKLELQRQGISETWIDAYLLTLLHPLNKRDILRGYQYGITDDDAIRASYRLIGYTDDAVDVLVQESAPIRRNTISTSNPIKQWAALTLPQADARQQLSTQGYPTEVIDQAFLDVEHEFRHSSYAEAYIRGTINRQQFQQLLQAWGVSAQGASNLADSLALRIADPIDLRSYVAGTIDRPAASANMLQKGMNTDIVNSLLNDADQNIKNTFAVACQQGTKTRYMHGELTAEESIANLVQFGVDTVRANALAANWKCEKSAIGKTVLASELCKWLSDGMITQADFYARLQKLGYTAENAELILNSCLAAYNRKAQADALKLAKQQQQEAKREVAAAQKQQAYIDRQNAKLASMRSKAATVRQNRDRQMLSAAERLYKVTDADLATAINKAKQMVQLAANQYGLGVDEALKVVLLAAEKFTGGGIDTFDADVTALAEAAASSGYDPLPPITETTSSSNGSIQPS
jgi:hypothetical protein